MNLIYKKIFTFGKQKSIHYVSTTNEMMVGHRWMLDAWRVQVPMPKEGQSPPVVEFALMDEPEFCNGCLVIGGHDDGGCVG